MVLILKSKLPLHNGSAALRQLKGTIKLSFFNTSVRSLTRKCVKFWLLQAKLKTTDLPSGRTLDGPQFANCGDDMLNQFLRKNGRKEYKRYGALFT